MKLSIYVDTTLQTCLLAAGIYSDKQGYPGARLATLSTTIPGKWNTILLPATEISAGTKYRVAILSPNASANPIVNLRFSNSGGLVETNAQTALTSLPLPWGTGTITYDDPLSAYGSGY